MSVNTFSKQINLDPFEDCPLEKLKYFGVQILCVCLYITIPIYLIPLPVYLGYAHNTINSKKRYVKMIYSESS